MGETAYTWDAQDRLTGVTLPDTTVIAYSYDADGRRVSQLVNNVETNYLWDETSPYGDVVLESDQNGNPLTAYTLANGSLISQTHNTATHFYLPDGQRSTRALTDAAGNLTDTYSYTAYGELFAASGTTANKYLYTGQQFDDLTGLYSLRARYYDPSGGRFLSRDTYPYNYRNPIELNRYGYTAGNPVNGWDPSGYEGIFGHVNQLREIMTSERWGGVAGFVVGVALGAAREFVKAFACPNESSTDPRAFFQTIALSTIAGVALAKAGQLHPGVGLFALGVGGVGGIDSARSLVSNLGKVKTDPLCYGALAVLDGIDVGLAAYDFTQGAKALRDGIDAFNRPPKDKTPDTDKPNTDNPTDTPPTDTPPTDNNNNTPPSNNNNEELNDRDRRNTPIYDTYSPRRPGLPLKPDGGWESGQLTDSEFSFLKTRAQEWGKDIVLSGSLSETDLGLQRRYNPETRQHLPEFRRTKWGSGLVDKGIGDVDVWEGSGLSASQYNELLTGFPAGFTTDLPTQTDGYNLNRYRDVTSFGNPEYGPGAIVFRPDGTTYRIPAIWQNPNWP